jgi:hypothetical protein
MSGLLQTLHTVALVIAQCFVSQVRQLDVPKHHQLGHQKAP